MKYGIFSASGEVKEKNYTSAWDIYDSDTDCKPLLESFDTIEEANAALKEKYRADVAKARSNGGYNFYFGTVYFTAQIEEEDGEIYPGDGYEITEIEQG